MTHESLRIIREEHASLRVMLRSLEALAERGPRAPSARYFTALRAVFFCIDEFYEAQQHPKESKLLFPKVAAASQQAAAAVLRLDQDHANGAASARELQHLLLAWEMVGSIRRATFKVACSGYIERLIEHIALEARLILPQAKRCLCADDWQRLDLAFARGGCAIKSSYLADPDYARLLAHISQTANKPPTAKFAFPSSTF